MQFYSYHGVFPEETKLGQLFYVDVELCLDLQQAGQSDNLQHTINYADVYSKVKSIMEDETYQLIEAVAERIAQVLLQSFTQLSQVMIKITKPTPPIPGHYDSVGVEIVRSQK